MTKTRKFEGKTYRFDTSWNSKHDAKARAKILRRRGDKARVVKATGKALGGRWRVYSRG